MRTGKSGHRGNASGNFVDRDGVNSDGVDGDNGANPVGGINFDEGRLGLEQCSDSACVPHYFLPFRQGIAGAGAVIGIEASA
jgi:hypothetical protein